MTDDERTIILKATHERQAQYDEGEPELAVFFAGLMPDLVEQAEFDLREGIDPAVARVDAVFASLHLRPLPVAQSRGVVRRRGIAVRAGRLWMSKPVLITVEVTTTARHRAKARVRVVAKAQRRREHSYFARVVGALDVASKPVGTPRARESVSDASRRVWGFRLWEVT